MITKCGSCNKRDNCGNFLLRNKDSDCTYLNYYITKIKDIAIRITSLK